MIRVGEPTMAICAGCGASAEAVEVRKPSDGSLTKAFLPAGWRTARSTAAGTLHLCCGCADRVEQPINRAVSVGYLTRRDLNHRGK